MHVISVKSHDGISTVFPGVNSSLYNNYDFRNKIMKNHHIGTLAFEDLNLDLVEQVVTDYMHTVLLGVTKKLLNTWVFNQNDKNTKFKNSTSEEFDAFLLTFNSSVPCDFARKHLSVKELSRWKASELRLSLLYTGVIILKFFLPSRYYEHFLSLHCAIKILCDKNLYSDYNEYANGYGYV